jgi:hypothetical protein
MLTKESHDLWRGNGTLPTRAIAFLTGPFCHSANFLFAKLSMIPACYLPSTCGQIDIQIAAKVTTTAHEHDSNFNLGRLRSIATGSAQRPVSRHTICCSVAQGLTVSLVKK